MAHSLHRKKRVRQNAKRNLANQSRRNALKTQIKKANSEIQRGTVEAASENLREACKLIDRAANQGTLHPNAAARRKSLLMRRLNKKTASGK